MTPTKESGESYTYGERLTKASLDNRILEWRADSNLDIVENRLVDGRIIFEEDGKLYLNQIEAVINTYQKFGYRNNQMVLQIAQPSDIELKDPPCLRSIDTRIQDNRLNFDVHFRSWDL